MIYESRFSAVSAKVSLLERANVSDARPLARLTSNNRIIQRHNGKVVFIIIVS